MIRWDHLSARALELEKCLEPKYFHVLQPYHICPKHEKAFLYVSRRSRVFHFCNAYVAVYLGLHFIHHLGPTNGNVIRTLVVRLKNVLPRSLEDSVRSFCKPKDISSGNFYDVSLDLEQRKIGRPCLNLLSFAGLHYATCRIFL